MDFTIYITLNGFKFLFKLLEYSVALKNNEIISDFKFQTFFIDLQTLSDFLII